MEYGYNESLKYLSSLGPKERKELYDLATKRYKAKQELIAKRFKNNEVNMEYAIDYSDINGFSGDKFVYGWFNDLGELFYIGQGTNLRVIQNTAHTRTDSFISAAGDNPSVYVFAKNVKKDIVDAISSDIEKMLMWSAQIINEPIVNKIGLLDVPVANEIMQVEFNHKPLSDCYPGAVIIYKDYKKLTEKYRDVLSAFYRCISMQYKKHNRSFEVWDECQARASNTRKENESNYNWTIDGVTRPRSQWCTLFNVNISSAVYLMDKYGISPKEAINKTNASKFIV